MGTIKRLNNLSKMPLKLAQQNSEHPGVSTDGIELFELRQPDNPTDELRIPQLAWAEVNALALPYAVLNERDARKSTGHEILKLEKMADKQIAFRWQVWPNPKLGMPTVLSLRILFVLMQKAADKKSELGHVPEVLEIGSLSALCRAVGLPADGYSRNLIKRHIRILAATQCMSQGTFKNKRGEGLFIDSFSYLRTVIFIGEKDAQGKTFDRNYVVFDEHVRANLNAHYVKQIDLALMREIRSPIGQLLYTKLSHLFNEAREKGWEYVEIEYQWLAERMGIMVYQQPFRAKAQLKQAIDELIAACYVQEATWIDWKIRLRPEVRYTFGEEKPRIERKRAARKRTTSHNQTVAVQAPKQIDPIDFMVPLCEVYAKNGWTMVSSVAQRHGITEDQLKQELLRRNIIITSTNR
ncbi:MAG: hypothetical protein IT342_25510 [Candidatus Melainabacteria bacterium]|nr:hypothetical protein [Candidatus Melainabacteria bacterium]